MDKCMMVNGTKVYHMDKGKKKGLMEENTKAAS